MTQIKIPCFVTNQKDILLYTFVMNSKKLREITYVLPRSRDNPEQIQRALDQKRVLQIGEYVKKENSYLPNNIVLNLGPEVYFEKSDIPDRGFLVFPGEKGKLGYILDGQHRLKGFEHSGGVEFDLPVTAFINAPKEIAYKTFADINSLQEKVKEVLLQLLKHEIGEYKPEEDLAISIVHELNDDKDSVFYGRIKVYPEDKKTWILAPTFGNYIGALVKPGGSLQGKSKMAVKTILKNYFKAFKEEFAKEWDDRKNYVLTKSMGIYLMCALFGNVYRRCDLYEGRSIETSAFRRQLQKLKNAKVSITSEVKLDFDWSSEKFGTYTSGKGLDFVRTELLRNVPPSDEE